MPDCDGCTMCCKLLGVGELKKRANDWCTHCNIGKGCSIYEQRPPTCQEFACLYRFAQKAPLALRPDKSKVVLAPSTNPNVICAHVDPGTPDAWKKEPVHSQIKEFAEAGFLVVISHGDTLEKVTLKRIGPGVVGKRTVTMTPPDENGMQWFHPKKEEDEIYE